MMASDDFSNIESEESKSRGAESERREAFYPRVDDDFLSAGTRQSMIEPAMDQSLS